MNRPHLFQSNKNSKDCKDIKNKHLWEQGHLLKWEQEGETDSRSRTGKNFDKTLRLVIDIVEQERLFCSYICLFIIYVHIVQFIYMYRWVRHFLGHIYAWIYMCVSIPIKYVHTHTHTDECIWMKTKRIQNPKQLQRKKIK